MELLPLGPVVLIDTPGLDDLGKLGKLRIQKATQMLQKTDLALLVVDGTVGASQEDLKIFMAYKRKRNSLYYSSKQVRNCCLPLLFPFQKNGRRAGDFCQVL